MTTPAPPAKKTNLFTRKIGPLPMWAWTGIILVPIIIYAVIEHKKSAASAADTTAADSTDASQVPQFVNQTYTNPTPPSAPGTPAPSPAGPTEAQFQQLAKSEETQAAINRSQTGTLKTLTHPKAPAKKTNVPPKKKPVPKATPKKK
jgi:hypothetical protein